MNFHHVCLTPLALMGLPCIYRITANHTSAPLLAPWEGKYRWLMSRRKQHSVQSYAAVVQFTATELIFHALVPLSSKDEGEMIPREGPP